MAYILVVLGAAAAFVMGCICGGRWMISHIHEILIESRRKG
jgi:hypothetical protein